MEVVVRQLPSLVKQQKEIADTLKEIAELLKQIKNEQVDDNRNDRVCPTNNVL